MGLAIQEWQTHQVFLMVLGACPFRRHHLFHHKKLQNAPYTKDALYIAILHQRTVLTFSLSFLEIAVIFYTALSYNICLLYSLDCVKFAIFCHTKTKAPRGVLSDITLYRLLWFFR